MKKTSNNKGAWARVLPLYLAAAVFLLCGILLPIYRLWALLAAAVLAVGGGVAAAALGRKQRADTAGERPAAEEKTTGGDLAGETLQKLEEAVKKLSSLIDEIEDPVLYADTVRMQDSCEKIADAVREKPQKARLCKRFLEYYLPMALKILESYVRLKEVNSGYENVEDTVDRVEDSMSTIATAFEKQVDSLYADEALDITTDLEVLESMLKSEGLAGEDPLRR